ncbi:MAG: dipicolinate synthase subunit B [Clostridia bacterium]|nr:dipicolinate synthase subunit B [Clostridia bacterium]
MIGYAMCGSFCTLERSIDELELLCLSGYEVMPIMSEICYATDTRFGKAKDRIRQAEELCGNAVIHTVFDAEPIGPKALLDALIISPCTGNTLAKLAQGVTDSSVTMAAKAHLRNHRPLVIALATNDALSANLKNIGKLLEKKNVYFVPFAQNDPVKKPDSMIADFSLIGDTLAEAMEGRQIQPILK